MDSPIRVILADDHPLVRAGIRTTLVAEGDFALVGEATTGDEARQMCCEMKPDILLLDIRMPGSPAVQTVIALRQQCPGTKILILTAYDSDAYVRGLISAGAVGYILKDEAPQKVVRAIRAVLQGDTWFSRAIVDKMKRLGIGEQAAVASPTLTEREIQVLQLVVKGKTNAAIAKELSISEPTVRFHLRSLYDKIGVRSRTEAAIWAVEHGWGSGKQDEPIGSDR